MLLLLLWEEPGRWVVFPFAVVVVEVLRPVGAGLPGVRDFGGEFSAEDRLWELFGRGGVFMPSSSSSIAWLPMLPLRAFRWYCISSHVPEALPCRLRGSGESLPTTFDGTGTGLAFDTGILDVLGRITCGRLCSAATSSGVRIS